MAVSVVHKTFQGQGLLESASLPCLNRYHALPLQDQLRQPFFRRLWLRRANKRLGLANARCLWSEKEEAHFQTIYGTPTHTDNTLPPVLKIFGTRDPLLTVKLVDHPLDVLNACRDSERTIQGQGFLLKHGTPPHSFYTGIQ
jgi:hypothetical protein